MRNCWKKRGLNAACKALKAEVLLVWIEGELKKGPPCDKSLCKALPESSPAELRGITLQKQKSLN